MPPLPAMNSKVPRRATSPGAAPAEWSFRASPRLLARYAGCAATAAAVPAVEPGAWLLPLTWRNRCPIPVMRTAAVMRGSRQLTDLPAAPDRTG